MAGFYYRCQSPDSNFQPSREALADSFASKCRILEASSIWLLFCDEQWLQHVNMLEQTPRLNWAMLQKVKPALHKDLVLYNEDHHPNHIVCFCPRFFLLGIASRRRELDCSSAPLIGQTLLCVPLGPSRGLMACAHDLLCLLISTIVQEPAPAGVQRKLRCPPLTAWDLEGGGRK